MSNPEQYKFESTSLTSPARGAFTITPANDTDLSEPTRAIYVGGTGHISVTMFSGDEVVFNSVQAGSFLPIRVKRVKSTGTTATNLIGVL